LNGFAVGKRSGLARQGRFMTRHGAIETPAFMPVGTQASVKSVSSAELAESGARLFIANTYHLWLRPGLEVIERFGGLHAFMRWPHAIATDSGGFQAFSLAERVRVDEDGYLFASHLDGSKLRLSPEEAMRIQGTLGSDIAMQLDVCLKAGVSQAELAAAVQRTERWGERCLAARREGQALFAIVQGGLSLDLRLAHARSVAALPYDGIALGGFSVGESPKDMHAVLAQLVPELDPQRPHYLMGVGTPSDVIRAIGVGVDLFDCVIPTRNARNGQVFTQHGKLAIRNAQHRLNDEPIDAACGCPACAGGYSRAYLRHLFIANEILALRLLTLHNLHFYQQVIMQARVAIAEDCYGTWAQAKLAALEVPAESL
jgi:queuine tRNA-ribosyltransferase